MKYLLFFTLVIIATLAIWLLHGRHSQPTTRVSMRDQSPQSDWIRVNTGSPELVKRAVLAYGEILESGDDVNFPVVLSRHNDGFVVLSFPNGLPAYPS